MQRLKFLLLHRSQTHTKGLFENSLSNFFLNIFSTKNVLKYTYILKKWKELEKSEVFKNYI